MTLKKISILPAAAVIALSSLNASAEWSEWVDYATATFDAQYWYRKPMENLKVMRRADTATPTRVQFKVCGMFGETPGCAPVDLIINANYAVQGPTSDDISIWVDDQYIESYDLYGTKTDIYLCDGYTYYDKYFPNNPDYAMQYEDASYMRQETGTFVIYSYYHYPDGTIPFLDAFYQDNAQGVETLRLHGPQFKNYTPDFTGGHFEAIDDSSAAYIFNVDIHDLSKVKMTIAAGASVDTRSIANQMNAGTIDCVTADKSGKYEVAFDNEAGDYSLVYLTYKADGTPYQYDSIALKYDPQWKQLGDATFTDGFISKFLEADMKYNLGLNLAESAFTYSVPIEESTETPGLYRLVNPYGETSPYWDINFSNVKIDKKATGYLIVNATDPERVHVEYSDCGFFYGSYPLVLYSEAHDWLNEGYSADQVPESLWGKMKDGVITFDEGTADNNLLAAKILTSPAAIYGRKLEITLPSAGVVAVEADDLSDAPVVYYNLQGIQTAHPVSGQLYIKRQGNKSEKIIF